ncbi:flavin reductase family protein [Arthrobacter crystallopoietes]|uniref:flavin reductase family protein n=1 Tax=Crystallibacter crystallopoietes TaxID=37928 RepID=UPI0011111C0A|nr:flavin reductase family protein [Arthrobacter crystallopoietes]
MSLTQTKEPDLSTYEPVVDESKLRQTLGHFGTGVVIVCATDENNEPTGMAINSFSSVSLRPPLISFCIAHDSSTWPKIAAASAFSVNILSEAQLPLGRKFSKRGIDRFAGVDWFPGQSGAPLLSESTAWLECEIYDQVPAGDHQVILGRVKHLDVGDPQRTPLMFFQSRFFGLRSVPNS